MNVKLKSHKFRRSSGALLHISSLPAEYGIGDFGPAAYRFADFLNQVGQTYWQILPLSPTDSIYGNSPYSSNSAYAMNILFISPELLVKDGWVTAEEIKPGLSLPKDRVDYPKAFEFKQRLLRSAYAKAKDKLAGKKDFQEFCADQAEWLDDYALFMVLKKKFSGQLWTQWPQDHKNRVAATLAQVSREQRTELEEIKFFQYLLFEQWSRLKTYCHTKKVQVIGDIPIYVNDDSVDVWANPAFFKLDENRQPRFVAGVPPDYFSQTGQRWGNPVYDWEALRNTDYEWWLLRLQHNLGLYDVVRIDHFRGLVDFWQIPAHESTAVVGEWVQGPGDEFLEAVLANFPNVPLIAEDLGILSPQVPETMERFQLPGMKILLFAFGGELDANPYPPDKYTPNCVAYTGTHDNNTIYGWWANDASMDEKKNLATYLRRNKIKRKGPLHWLYIEMLMQSVANMAIFPLQDILGLGAEGRMNTPGIAQGNWEWRWAQNTVDAAISKKFKQLTEDSKRI